MSNEIRVDVPKGTKVRVFEEGVEVQPRMSDEQFAELLEAIHKAQPQFVPMPYPYPTPITVPLQPWQPCRIYTTPSTCDPMPPKFSTWSTTNAQSQ